MPAKKRAPTSGRPKFLALASSARFIVQSIIASGFSADAVDGFADSDTLQYAGECLRTRLSRCGSLSDDVYQDCQALIEKNDYAALVPGPGVESCQAALEALAAHLPLAGNRPELMRACAQRSSLSAYLQGVDGLKTLPKRDLWVRKPAYSHGGVQAELSDLTDLNKNGTKSSEWTPYMAGTVVSQLFIAAQGQAKTIGFSTQWQSHHNPDRPFCFGGAVNGSDLHQDARHAAQQCADRLSQALSLRGLNNLDYLWDGDHLYLLELNPRLGSSIQLHEGVLADGLFAAHWQACQSLRAFMDEWHAVEPHVIRAYAPIYAQTPWLIPAGFDEWPEGTADKPDLDSAALRLSAGQPLCTVTAQGDSMAEALRLLQWRMRQLIKAVDRQKQV